MTAAYQDSDAALREARAVLAKQMQALDSERRRIDMAIKALDAVINPGGDVRPPMALSEVVRGLQYGPTRTKIRPALIEVMKAHPGVHHIGVITSWVGERVAFTATNPMNSIATALLRMAEKGQVRNHGQNRWEWIGGDFALGDDDDES